MRRRWGRWLTATTISVGVLSGCTTLGPRSPAAREGGFRDHQADPKTYIKEGPPPVLLPSSPKEDGSPITPPDAGPVLGSADQPHRPSTRQTIYPVTADPPPVPPAPTPTSFPGVEINPNGQSQTAKKETIPQLSAKKEPLLDALQCILDNRPHEALSHLQNYDPATQELLLRLLPYIDLVRRKGLHQLKGDEVAVLHDQLQEMMHLLRPRTELVIDKACFCEYVKAFGVYKPLADDHVFCAAAQDRPGESVQLYVQLRNFRSEPRGPFHETCLASSVEIRDPKGAKIWEHQFNDRKLPLRSRARLHDYFSNYSFPVPSIPAGAYTLTIQIVDETCPDQPRIVRKTLPFSVRSVPGRP